MTLSYSEFEASLEKAEPSATWPIVLRALWYDAKEDWNKAHDLVDQMSDTMAKGVHAYLHRKEGDEWNAAYWYRQAGKPFCKLSLEEEFRTLVSEFVH